MHTDLSIASLVLGASLLVKFVMLVLLAASVASWSLIFAKRRQMRRAKQDIKAFEDLPSGLKELIERSFALQDRIIQLDRAMSFRAESAAPIDEAPIANPVIAQMSLLQSAFRR